MRKETELWSFVADRLRRGERVTLLVVAESSGSSPGRAGYKMAVAEDGELTGSIGGGVMEVSLVERAKKLLSVGPFHSQVVEQEHRKNSSQPSGMICSGDQTVILKLLTPEDAATLEDLDGTLTITANSFGIGRSIRSEISFTKRSETDFTYIEYLGFRNELIIIGGGHCALALSEMMSKMHFSIQIFDDRPELNTIEKNDFADEVAIIDSYETIADHVPSGENVYVVVMTLGFKTDAVVIRELAGRKFKYLGVLGSKAKMATLMRDLKDEGVDAGYLASIRTPIGIPINSHTPEEIAVSIAAEIISIKNS